ncbi:MAG: hypothetical protein IT454_17065 [Planctomycetes bacterium]|nr:hypothetical protein [Planctomycetota bacterium]
MRSIARNLATLVLATVTAAVAAAQSFNIDCNNVFAKPTNAYGAAAAQPGYWTNVDGFGLLAPQPLFDTAGAATSVTMDATTGFNFAFDNALTSGNDAALLDDLQDINGATTWTIAGLSAGNYKVFAYAWAPDNVSYVTGVNVVGGANGTQNCGGAAWSGAHVAGVTYVADQVNAVPSGGSITIQFTTVTGFGSANGIQIVKLPNGPAPTPYCTSGTSTNGCQPLISATNNPSLSLAAPCAITIQGVEGQKNGIVFYGLTPNFAGSSWCGSGTSLLCVKSPTQRTSNQNSGGTAGLCDGQISLNWDTYQLTHPGALGNPWFVGATAHVQGWYRDPPACKTTQLTQAITLTYLP